MGDWRQGVGRQGVGRQGEGRQEKGDRRWGTGDGRQETGEGRKQTGDMKGFSDVISEKFSAYNLVGEFINFLRMLIANRKYKLAGAAKSAEWGKNIQQFSAK